MPAALIAALFGTQYQKAALNAVPPSVEAFSRISTLLPYQREKSADGRPLPPPPTTTMSYSASKLAACASSTLSVDAPNAATAAVPAPAVLRKSRRDGFGVSSAGRCVSISPPVTVSHPESSPLEMQVERYAQPRARTPRSAVEICSGMGHSLAGRRSRARCRAGPGNCRRRSSMPEPAAGSRDVPRDSFDVNPHVYLAHLGARHHVLGVALSESASQVYGKEPVDD